MTFIIAIDGPAGSGKSSAARLLAKKLGYIYLDTGALYRAVAWKALNERTDLQDPKAVKALCADLKLILKPSGDTMKVYLGGQDITAEIRTPEVSHAASAVAALAAVRERLLGVQQEIGDRGGVVVEGRDIGTVVFPKADLKFFLEASPDVRMMRRYQELKEQGLAVDLEATRKELDQRDRKDAGREIAPMRPAEDAIRIDTSALPLDEVVAAMLEAIRRKVDRIG